MTIDINQQSILNNIIIHITILILILLFIIQYSVLLNIIDYVYRIAICRKIISPLSINQPRSATEAGRMIHITCPLKSESMVRCRGPDILGRHYPLSTIPLSPITHIPYPLSSILYPLSPIPYPIPIPYSLFPSRLFLIPLSPIPYPLSILPDYLRNRSNTWQPNRRRNGHFIYRG